MSRHLFLCETPLFLFNALLCRVADSSESADILLTDASDLSPYVGGLERLGLFDDVRCIQTRARITALLGKPPRDRSAACRNPGEVIALPEDIAGRRYSDLWICLPNMCEKLVYYALVHSQGAAPAVHFVEEGVASYYIDVSKPARDPFDHASYKGESFACNCKEALLHDPEAFCGDASGFDVGQLPRELLEDGRFLEAVRAVFETEDIPQERCIFFEQCFSEDGNVTNDLELFETVARSFGKGDVLVRLHPRTKIDRFSPLGYRTDSSRGRLWEATLLDRKDLLEGKVFVSVDSTACLSPGQLFGPDCKTVSILLDRLVWGDYKGKADRAKLDYLAAIEKKRNANGMKLYRPASQDELILILDRLTRF